MGAKAPNPPPPPGMKPPPPPPAPPPKKYVWIPYHVIEQQIMGQQKPGRKR
jgi:hypothetical protein